MSEFAKLLDTLRRFVVDECMPAEQAYRQFIDDQPAKGRSRFAQQPPVMEQLRLRARQLGLFNLFIFPHYSHVMDDLNLNNGSDKQFRPRTLVEYAKCCEIVGLSPKLAAEATNCNAPDTGNMELLARYGSAEQKRKYLVPLLKGEIRSAFAMTEPDVASSDALNIACRIEGQGDQYVINGRKWWISNALHPNLKFYLLLGKIVGSDKEQLIHRRHSIVLIPADAPGVTVKRPMQIFGYDDAVEGHCEVIFENVRIAVKDGLIYKEGSGFEIMQSRLGPGRIHHCMRAIGMAERVIYLLCQRARQREAFGKKLAEFSDVQHSIALHRTEIEKCRALVYKVAHDIDTYGQKHARLGISMIKV